MGNLSPIYMMLLGLLLLLLGICGPFLMIIQVLESTLLLNFLAYLASLGGLVLGIVGVVSYTQRK
jgi:hypothetical protein